MQHEKFQIYTLKINTIIWHCKINSGYFSTRVYAQALNRVTSRITRRQKLSSCMPSVHLWKESYIFPFSMSPLNAIHRVHLALDVVTWATAIEPNIFVIQSKGIYECWQLNDISMHEYTAFHKLHTWLNMYLVISVYIFWWMSYPSMVHWCKIITGCNSAFPLLWRHNGRVSNHQPHDCLLNRYSDADQRKHQSSASLASNAENVSIWWRHRALW